MFVTPNSGAGSTFSPHALQLPHTRLSQPRPLRDRHLKLTGRIHRPPGRRQQASPSWPPRYYTRSYPQASETMRAKCPVASWDCCALCTHLEYLKVTHTLGAWRPLEDTYSLLPMVQQSRKAGRRSPWLPHSQAGA